MSSSPSSKASDPKQLESGLDIEIPHDDKKTKKTNTANTNNNADATNGSTPASDATSATKTSPASSSSSATSVTNNEPNPTSTNSTTTPANTSQSTKPVRFTTDKIGQWKSSQANPFAEQNRKQQAKKEKQAATRKKAIPIIAIIAGVVAVLAIVITLIIINTSSDTGGPTITIAGSDGLDIVAYRDSLEDIYNRDPDGSTNERLQEVQNAVDRTLKTGNGKKYKNEVLVAQVLFYLNNGLYYNAIDAGLEVDPEQLDSRAKQMYYNFMSNAYGSIGNDEMAVEYTDKLFQAYGESSNESAEDQSE